MIKGKIKNDAQSSSLVNWMGGYDTKNFGEEIGMKRKMINLVLDTLFLRCLDHPGGAPQVMRCLKVKGI